MRPLPEDAVRPGRASGIRDQVGDDPAVQPGDLRSSGRCARRSRGRVRRATLARHRQPLLYGSKEHTAVHRNARNAQEGVHGFAKDDANEAIGNPGLRRRRGLAAQSLYAAVGLAVAGIRKIVVPGAQARGREGPVLRPPSPARQQRASARRRRRIPRRGPLDPLRRRPTGRRLAPQRGPAHNSHSTVEHHPPAGPPLRAATGMFRSARRPPRRSSPGRRARTTGLREAPQGPRNDRAPATEQQGHDHRRLSSAQGWTFVGSPPAGCRRKSLTWAGP